MTQLVQAGVSVTDDSGRVVRLESPARRIVSLAPYLTELLFTAGAGEAVVGVSGFSDYPPAARSIPRVSGGIGLDLERIVTLRPDLVIAWQSGNPAGQIERLRALGIRVFISEPRRLEDIGATLQRLGRLTGMEDRALSAREAFDRRLADLRRRNAGKTPVSVFYQVWSQPLMTVSGNHIVSDVIRLCRGINVFSDLTQLAPHIGIESVLQRDPQVMITASGSGGDFADAWQRWPVLQAVHNNRLFTLPGDLLVRHSPRILDGAELLCGILDRVREEDL